MSDRYQPRHMALSHDCYVAVCPDRQVRHDGTFPTVGDADQWATDWQHRHCFGMHRVLLAEAAQLLGLAAVAT